jgi:hypothetical protein
MEKELKRCPFCGGEADVEENSKCYGVECRTQECGSVGIDWEMGHAFDTEQAARDAWNKRA